MTLYSIYKTTQSSLTIGIVWLEILAKTSRASICDIFSCFSEVKMVWLMLVMALAVAEAQDSTPGTSKVSFDLHTITITTD